MKKSEVTQQVFLLRSETKIAIGLAKGERTRDIAAFFWAHSGNGVDNFNNWATGQPNETLFTCELALHNKHSFTILFG